MAKLSILEEACNVWLGAYKAKDGEAKWQDGCSGVDASYLEEDFESKEACFLLAVGSVLKAESCTTELPYVCQASTLEIDKCFTRVNVMTDVKSAVVEVSEISSPLDCYPTCIAFDRCVGFKYSSSTCSLLEFFTGTSSFAKGTLYMRDLLRTNAPNDVTGSISDLQNICSNSVSKLTQMTPSSTTSTTSSSVSTSTAPSSVSTSTAPSSVSTSTAPSSVSTSTAPSSVSTSTAPSSVSTSTAVISITSSTAASKLAGPADLQSSSPEPVTVEKSSSESTSPLTTLFTSVYTETATIQETETPPMSCSHCSCIKSKQIGLDELKESISKLKEQLSVNRKELSSFKRKLTSAPDDRQSAANIGYVGTLIICLIPGFIILLDMGRFTRELQHFISRLRNSDRTVENATPLKCI
ncbi:A-agglutinin anchorage subunit-like [Pecten maximus]|uniref:A-agglutinin anchorage subunit-like n=1 Tax=Pecten maximus TaxID=6579 RepID=UPI0014591B1F|nr:A-agglutinin anchorage subunit-like [Pecten maximus]